MLSKKSLNVTKKKKYNIERILSFSRFLSNFANHDNNQNDRSVPIEKFCDMKFESDIVFVLPCFLQIMVLKKAVYVSRYHRTIKDHGAITSFI